ncbi:MAG TPA: histidine phosphatase family protein, partial [Ktedonobacter sp.]|nr:histidine phosphatase family protein [Ktedonobacter sp.]
LPVITMEQFREVNVGDLEGQPTNKENWAMHDQIIADWFSGKHDSIFPGGENYTMLLQRMNDGLRTIMIDNPDSNIIIVAHGGIITSTISDMCTNVDLSTLLQAENANCSITEMKAELYNGRIVGELVLWAYHGHLHGEAAKLVAGHPNFE